MLPRPLNVQSSNLVVGSRDASLCRYVQWMAGMATGAWRRWPSTCTVRMVSVV